ncbi:hydrogenase 2 operon protein HybA [Superficieibacter sp. 1612_C1]|uniref:hydrogenase 2 operon protein HybA n=1 Tax=Superficieibacter sp. 1612_C1 TaxID=2780382 RepID=UPI001883FC5E|nr:hydrogenase 2 operon protein HybA [Superficieibacter sp. 1612_C1]
MNRRHFFKVASGGLLLAGVAPGLRAAEQPRQAAPGAVGMLFDSTLCVGCQSCVTKCQQINNPGAADYRPDDNSANNTTSSVNDKLSARTNNIIQIWRSGNGEHKNQLQDGYAFIKKQCMHCVDPNCVSACPVSALQKNAATGIVEYNPDACTGCRYCMVACPYNVPKYDYSDPFGAIHKCELCNQKGVERLDKGQLPGCTEVCPTGAVIFGTRDALLKEAKARLALKPGSRYDYPRQQVGSKDTYSQTVAQYQSSVYGEIEGGGTQVLVLSAIPFQKFGLPALGPQSTGSRAEHVQHTLYKGMMLPAAALAGITWLVHRNNKHHDAAPSEEENSHE